MNKIILIGNGFDLAHNLKTKYIDFIFWVWKNIREDLFNPVRITKSYDKKHTPHCETTDINQLVYIVAPAIEIIGSHYRIVKNNIIYKKKIPIGEGGNLIKDITKLPITYNNKFLELITKSFIEQSWSDIEQLYYDTLLKYKDSSENIEKLNKDFEQIKGLLITYLKGQPKPNKIDEIEEEILVPILPNNISSSHLKKYKADIVDRTNFIEENQYKNMNFKLSLSTYEININNNVTMYELPLANRILLEVSDIHEYKEKDIIYDLLSPNNIYLLSFNYTTSEKYYIKHSYNNLIHSQINISSIHIHGELENENNPIIFGYGDEYDDNYNELEKSKIKGVLDNIKSMKYLETSNYKRFENIINSAPYQVVIMGHSCGLTDKTLLKTLFEHKNCASIKPYYYKDKTGWDNYNEIIQAISRCFTDKSKLRSIVVNKEYCKPLPQANQNIIDKK